MTAASVKEVEEPVVGSVWVKMEKTMNGASEEI